MKQHTRRIQAKGTSRRVVIVPGDEDGLFGQIIYVVRDDAASQRGVSAEEILRQARESLGRDPEPGEERERVLFSRPVLVLVMIALLLAAAILVLLWMQGWI